MGRANDMTARAGAGCCLVVCLLHSMTVVVCCAVDDCCAPASAAAAAAGAVLISPVSSPAELAESLLCFRGCVCLRLLVFAAIV